MREDLKAAYEPAKDAAKLGKLSKTREFRDALTRATGAIQGARTNMLQWMDISGSK
jgi:hypothetical protein